MSLQHQHFGPEAAREVAELMSREERELLGCQGVNAEKSRASHRVRGSLSLGLAGGGKTLSVPHSEMKYTPDCEPLLAGRAAGEQQQIKRQ